MALDMWYRNDISNALAAAKQASRAALQAVGKGDDAFVAGYEAGYRVALVTVALAFGPGSAGHPPQTRKQCFPDEGNSWPLSLSSVAAETAVRRVPAASPHIRTKQGEE